VFSIVVEDSETVPKVLSLLRAIGEIIDVKYGEKTWIIAYIQMGMIKELTKLGIEIRAN